MSIRAQRTNPRMQRTNLRIRRTVLAVVTTAALAGCAGTGTTSAAPTGATTPAALMQDVAAQVAGLRTAPATVAHTAAGDVGYRKIGTGSPLVLITGLGASMDNWPPSFLGALAQHHTVVILDNAGVGASTPAAPLTIQAMSEQTSALISAMKLHRPAVLGWSMGGMVAQALAIGHPGQVSKLVLAATQPGTGKAVPIPATAADSVASGNPKAMLAALFPDNQTAAAQGYAESLATYPDYYAPSAAVIKEQSLAIGRWMAGKEAVGTRLDEIHVPTLVADGTLDALDPQANDQMLAHTIPGARLVLYPDAGHAFLFQDASQFIPTVDRFLSR